MAVGIFIIVSTLWHGHGTLSLRCKRIAPWAQVGQAAYARMLHAVNVSHDYAKVVINMNGKP